MKAAILSSKQSLICNNQNNMNIWLTAGFCIIFNISGSKTGAMCGICKSVTSPANSEIETCIVHDKYI